MVLAKTKIGSLNDILSTRVKMEFPHRVNFTTDDFPYDRHNEMIKWCEDNCQGIWRYETTYALYFQFDNDRDAMLFALKWR